MNTQHLKHVLQLPLCQLWKPRPNPMDQIEITFPKNTLLPTSYRLALIKVKTPQGIGVSIDDHLFPDTSWTNAEPLLPCFMHHQKIRIPAGTYATCVPVDTATYQRWVNTEQRLPIHSIDYVGDRLVYGDGSCLEKESKFQKSVLVSTKAHNVVRSKQQALSK